MTRPSHGAMGAMDTIGKAGTSGALVKGTCKLVPDPTSFPSFIRPNLGNSYVREPIAGAG